MRIGLWLTPRHDALTEILPDIIQFLEKNHQEIILNDVTWRNVFSGESIKFVTTADLPQQIDALFSIGGDGTFLSASRLMARSGKPVLGIHLGGLGFLADVSFENYTERLAAFLRGEYSIEERNVLAVRTIFPEKVLANFAFNDIVIDRGRVSTTIKIRTFVNGDFLNTYRADGIIIASPTGSTAYSLSAGGPIISPELNVFVISPICPHSLSVRPVVISADSVVSIDCSELAPDVSLVMDGQERQVLERAERVEIQKADFTLPVVRFPGDSFFHTLRTKLNWGRDIRGN